MRITGGALVVAKGEYGQAYFEGKWYVDGRPKKRRLGRAHLVADDGSYSGTRRRTRWKGWLRARGKAPEGVLDEEAGWRELRSKQALYVEQEKRKQERRHRIPDFYDCSREWLT